MLEIKGENFINKKISKKIFYYDKKGNMGIEIKNIKKILNRRKDIENICINF